MIDVDDGNRNRIAAAHRTTGLPGQGVFEKAPVVEAGKLIAYRLAAQLLPQFEIGDGQGDLLRKHGRQLVGAGRKGRAIRLAIHEAEEIVLRNQRLAHINAAGGLATRRVAANKALARARKRECGAPAQRPAIIQIERSRRRGQHTPMRTENDRVTRFVDQIERPRLFRKQIAGIGLDRGKDLVRRLN
jgi:hypothetical protein